MLIKYSLVGSKPEANDVQEMYLRSLMMQSIAMYKNNYDSLLGIDLDI